MNIKAVLKHLDADGSDGCFNLYDADNRYMGAISVSDAEALATSIGIQIQAARTPKLSPAEEELADNARREALNGSVS